MLEGFVGSPQQTLARVLARETQNALDKAKGTHASCCARLVSPGPKRCAHPFAPPKQLRRESPLARRDDFLSGLGCVVAGSNPKVRGDEGIVVIDAHELVVPTHLNAFTQQLR